MPPKETITLTIGTHRGQQVILIGFDYSDAIKAKVRKFDEARWSKTMGVWYIPYSREAFSKLMELFPKVECNRNKPADSKDEGMQQSELTGVRQPNSEPVISIAPDSRKGMVKITITEKQIFIVLPKNETDCQFLRSFRYYRWDKNRFCWIIPNWNKNSELIRSYFKDRNAEYETVKPLTVQPDKNLPVYTQDQLLVINRSGKYLKIYSGYHNDLTARIKSMPLSRWEAKEHCWTVPYAEKFIKDLQALADNMQLEFVYREDQKNKVKPKITEYDIGNYRKCPTEYVEKLKELRYSGNTIKTYSGLFEEFINYYPGAEIHDIREDQITTFLRYLVNERCVSTSYQNQSINAIKFYYDRVLSGGRKIYRVERPREEKCLPEVLSEKEVMAILNATENLKHKAILMTIYSGGLRISEAINLKIKVSTANECR
jgi:hypothetical protein